MYTLGTAAKATGKAKSTISKAIKDGLISAQTNENGSYTIEPSELHRVFPPVSANSPDEPQLDELEPSDLRFENGLLKGELKQLHERLAGIDSMQERERRALSDQIEDLRKRLDQSEQERRDKDRQLTALLGSLTQRYVKRHRLAWKSSEISPLCGFLLPHLSLRFRDDFLGVEYQLNPGAFHRRSRIPRAG